MVPPETRAARHRTALTLNCGRFFPPGRLLPDELVRKPSPTASLRGSGLPRTDPHTGTCRPIVTVRRAVLPLTRVGVRFGLQPRPMIERACDNLPWFTTRRQAARKQGRLRKP